jgi:hypothetical protein
MFAPIALFAEQQDQLFQELTKFTQAHKGLWCLKAEEYLLANARLISV